MIYMRMRSNFLLLLMALAALFSACKKEETADSEASLLEVTEILSSATAQYKIFLEQVSGDFIRAADTTATWLKTQPTVRNAVAVDFYIFIYLKSGLKTGIIVELTDDRQFSIYRGGGGGSALKATAGNCSHSVQNNKVLIYAAAFSDFYKNGQMDNILNIFDNSTTSFDVTLLTNEQCTPDAIATFSNYGLVILDTHGEPEGFMTGTKIIFSSKPVTEQDIRDKILQQAGAYVLEKVLKGQLVQYTHLRIPDDEQFPWEVIQLNNEYRIWVNTEMIESDVPDLSETILFGNMCYSGWLQPINNSEIDKPIAAAFIGKNPVSYYGYTYEDGTSRMAHDFRCKQFEDSLVTSFVIDYDSTGNSHLKTDGTNLIDSASYYEKRDYKWKDIPLKQYEKNDYCFGCGGSITDARDGEIYKTVCIGDQIWMAENLRYNAPGSVCYDNNTAHCATYGRLYSWNMVMDGEPSSNFTPSGVEGICPPGWHVPSNNEWQKLVLALGGVSIAGGVLKDISEWDNPNTGATNSSGFSALPGGYTTDFSVAFYEKGTYARFWTSSGSTSDTDLAFHRNLNSNSTVVGDITFYKGHGLACRCVRD